MPADRGFGEAALQLAPAFRVSSTDMAFVERHRSEPFLLPINFLQTIDDMPVNRHFTGLSPLRFPDIVAPPDAVDSNAPPARFTVLCTVRERPSGNCEVERATPENNGYYEAVALMLQLMPIEAGHGLIPGDQIRFDIIFAPPT
jgi:hypothetical protein